MIVPNQIGWGEYTTFEGPYFRGVVPYKLPKNPDFLDKCLAVITATEGGKYDAINMYDRCIVSVGVIQCCESAPVFGVTSLLARCMEAYPALVKDTLYSTFPISVEFKKNSQGIWRFFQDGREITHQDQQRKLWFGAPNKGGKGSWDKDSIEYAKKVAVMLANLWEDPTLREAQDRFNKARLMTFIWPMTKQILFSDQEEGGWVGALKAAFLSFAANLPSVAEKSFKLVTANPEWREASPERRFALALQALTFSPGIAIYPGRYDKIAPVLRQLFGVDVPRTSEELKVWEPPKVEFSQLERDMLARWISLSTAVEQGTGLGLAALDLLPKE